VGNVGAHPVRHHGGEVSGGLKTQAAVVLWVRKNSELKGRARERSRWKATSRTSARRAVLKGTGLTLHLRRRARRVSETFSHARAPRRNNYPQPRRLGSRGMRTCRACVRS
jgi:hypothetical protein